MRKIGKSFSALGSLVVLCFFSLAFLVPQSAFGRDSDKGKPYQANREYQALIKRLEPTPEQVLLIDNLAEKITRFESRHPEPDQALRISVRNVIASRQWKPVYVNDLMANIRTSHQTLVNDLYGDLVVLHKTMTDKQKKAASLYLHDRLRRLDQLVDAQLDQVESYGGLLATLFVGFGSEQRDSLGHLIDTVRKAYRSNAAIRLDIAALASKIISKKSITKTDLKAYLEESNREFAAYEIGVIDSARAFLNSLDDYQKGRLVYLFDDAEKNRQKRLELAARN